MTDGGNRRSDSGGAATPKALRSDALRNRMRLLEVASDAFAAGGLAMPVDEIARRAGVGAGSIYRHFGTKEGLFRAVMRTRIDGLAETARSLRAAEDPGAAFFEFFSLMIAEATGNRALAENIASEGLEFDLGEGASPHEFEAELEHLLRRAQRAGAVRADVEPADIKSLLMGCVATASYGLGPSGDRVIGVIRDGLRA